MKTIMKYELIINEALRSALDNDIPDDEINEFIRFFGVDNPAETDYETLTVFLDMIGMILISLMKIRN
ncbi:MAG: hypothetical protein MR361_09555 [Clostridiales bacterium]|nr:hypothetical protein [Clostridiales bacterium]MDD6292276.1 hypothetical protein [Eubacteriales bacterium]